MSLYLGNTLVAGLTDLSDIAEVQCVVETYNNGTSWYRVYSDGWCEQGGELTSEPYTVDDFDVPIVLLQAYKDTNYNVTTSGILATTHQRVGGESAIYDKSTTGFSVHGYNGYVTSTNPFMWQACGYIS